MKSDNSPRFLYIPSDCGERSEQKQITDMTYMYEVTVVRKYTGGGVQLPEGLSVRVAHDVMSNPLNSASGRQRIAQAFLMQCGVDLSRCITAISPIYMAAERM